jgi:hypothetical protein
MSEGGQGAAARLAATVDGAPLLEDEARALWTEFSRHMDEHRGDTAGFALQRGWFSVTPTHQAGRAVLVVRTKEGPAEAPPSAAPFLPSPPLPGRGAGGGAGAKRRKRRR